MSLTLLLLMLSASPLSVGQVKGLSRAHALKPHPIPRVFRSLPPQIKRSTNIPILLPTRLPPKWARYRLHSSSESEADLWKVFVEVKPNCGNACMVGYIEAKRGEKPPPPDEVDQVVQLAHRVKGYYTGKSCGGSCTPPQISWVSDGVLYTIQF